MLLAVIMPQASACKADVADVLARKAAKALRLVSSGVRDLAEIMAAISVLLRSAKKRPAVSRVSGVVPQ